MLHWLNQSSAPRQHAFLCVGFIRSLDLTSYLYKTMKAWKTIPMASVWLGTKTERSQPRTPAISKCVKFTTQDGLACRIQLIFFPWALRCLHHKVLFTPGLLWTYSAPVIIWRLFWPFKILDFGGFELYSWLKLFSVWWVNRVGKEENSL